MERKLATGGHDGQVRLWDPKTGKPLGDILRGHTKWVMSLAWEPIHINPSSPRLASSSKDGTVRVWNTSTRQLEFSLGSHTASVNVVKWGGGGAGGKGVLYTGSSDRTVKVWDASSVSQNLTVILFDLFTDGKLGEAHAYAERSRALGEHFGLEHGFHPSNWALRSYQ